VSEYFPGQSTWRTYEESQKFKTLKKFVNEWQYPVMTILGNITKNTFERFESWRESFKPPEPSGAERKLRMAEELKETRQYSHSGLTLEEKIAKSKELKQKRLMRTSRYNSMKNRRKLKRLGVHLKPPSKHDKNSWRQFYHLTRELLKWLQ